MELFKEYYGRLGRLHRSEWKRMLNSNTGLFRRARSAPPYIIGPTLDEHGRVTADLKVMETVYFESVASKEQRTFFKELKSVNPIAADEYMLIISGSIKKWKEDMKLLVLVLRYLRREESALKEEENLISEEEKVKVAVKLPLVLRRHFPHFFKSVDLEGLDFRAQLDKIKEIKRNVCEEKDYLKDYIKKRRREMPFLFE